MSAAFFMVTAMRTLNFTLGKLVLLIISLSHDVLMAVAVKIADF